MFTFQRIRIRFDHGSQHSFDLFRFGNFFELFRSDHCEPNASRVACLNSIRPQQQEDKEMYPCDGQWARSGRNIVI